jgi:FkbM family methyltransferase
MKRLFNSLKIKALVNGIRQRLYFIKNFRKGFSFIFLLPGSIREKFQEHAFFQALVKNNNSIRLEKIDDVFVLEAKDFKFKFPKNSFFEADFFDIIYPHLNIKDPLIESHVYQNDFYPSEGEYEKFGVNLTKGDIVIDAGANVGTFSIIASKIAGNEGCVFSFEPLTEITEYLKENMEINNCSNIVIENLILGDDNKNIDFFYNLDTDYNGSSKIFTNHNSVAKKITQITLDKYVNDNNVPRVDFIKADIEGAERELLKGAEVTIKKYRPKIAIRTYHLPDDEKVLFDLLHSFVPEYNLVQNKKTLYAWVDEI